MNMRAVLQAAFNLLVCCYALGDKEGMMAAFQRLLTVPGLAEAKALQVSLHAQFIGAGCNVLRGRSSHSLCSISAFHLLA